MVITTEEVFRTTIMAGKVETNSGTEGMAETEICTDVITMVLITGWKGSRITEIQTKAGEIITMASSLTTTDSNGLLLPEAGTETLVAVVTEVAGTGEEEPAKNKNTGSLLTAFPVFL